MKRVVIRVRDGSTLNLMFKKKTEQLCRELGRKKPVIKKAKKR